MSLNKSFDICCWISFDIKQKKIWQVPFSKTKAIQVLLNIIDTTTGNSFPILKMNVNKLFEHKIFKELILNYIIIHLYLSAIENSINYETSRSEDILQTQYKDILLNV